MQRVPIVENSLTSRQDPVDAVACIGALSGDDGGGDAAEPNAPPARGDGTEPPEDAAARR